MKSLSPAGLYATAALLLCVSMAAAQETPPPPPSGLTVVEQPAPPAPPPPSGLTVTEQPAPPAEAAPAPGEPAAALEAPPAPPALPASAAEQLDPGSSRPVEPPAEPAPDTAATEPVSAEPVPDAAAAMEPAPEVAATTGPKRILVLPLEFTVYERSVAGLEVVPDWTEAARRNLLESSGRALRGVGGFELISLPPLEGEANDVLREHVELFKIVSDTVTSVVHAGGKAWEEKKTHFDYTIGDGLAFLTEIADYAFILGGGQIKQTGGSTFMQLLAAGVGYYVPGGGTYVAAGIVDLRTGEVFWLNSMQGGEFFGMTTNDTRKPEAAEEIVAKMFEGYPASRWVTVRPF